MDPELDRYISLEEETTTSTPQRSDSPKDVVPSLPTLAEDDAALLDGSSGGIRVT